MLNDSHTPTWQDNRKTRLHKVGINALLVGMFTLTAALYALLMARDRVPLTWLAGLAILGLAHWALAGWRRSTPLDLPILGLLVLMPLNLAVTIDRGDTIPKIYGVILGAALFYIIAQFVNIRGRLHLALLALVALSVAIAGLGLVGTDWSSIKVIELPRVYDALPRLVEGVPRSQDGGIQANLVGGALAFLIPFLFSLLWDRGGFSLARIWDWRRDSRPLKIAYRILVILSLLMVLFTLLLTQSRGGMVAALVGVLAAAIWHERRFLWAIPVLFFNALLGWWFLAEANITNVIRFLDTRDGFTITQRLGIFERALYLVQDFPISGTGIGTYSALINMFYIFSEPTETFTLSHAHNQFLVVATDLGLPGLVLYAALLGGFAAMVVRTWPYAGRQVKAVLAGLAGGMLAHQVFGIMDAFMLGSKLAALFWIYLGLGAALYIHRGHFCEQYQAPRQVSLGRWEHLKAWLAFMFQGFAGWVGVSVVAVAFVHTNTILSLLLAVVGGIALGVLLVGVYEDTFLKRSKVMAVELTEDGIKTEDRGPGTEVRT